MAKKKTKGKHQKPAAALLAPSLLPMLMQAANSPVGRVLIAEALVLAAGALMPRHPVRAATAVGADAADAAAGAAGAAAGAARSAASSAGEAMAKLLHFTADQLRGTKSAPHESHKAEARYPGNLGDRAFAETGGRHGPWPGNGPNEGWEDIDRETMRRAVMADIGKKKKGKKHKAAKGH